MFRDGWPGHIKILREGIDRQALPGKQEQHLPAAGVTYCPETDQPRTVSSVSFLVINCAIFSLMFLFQPASMAWKIAVFVTARNLWLFQKSSVPLSLYTKSR
jgi:hypothetical protein